MNAQIFSRLATEPCLIASSACVALMDRAMKPRAAEPEFLRDIRNQLRPTVTMTPDGLAIVPVNGILARRPTVWELMADGIEATDVIHEIFASATANPEVRGILLDVDSPGGFLTGGPELADAVRAADKRAKPVHAWTGGSMASLAYWIGSQAGHVTATRSASVGSIGVYAAIPDYSKLFEAAGVKMEVIRNDEAAFKAAGLPGTSLTDEQRAEIQASIQRSFEEFSKAVGVRKMSPDAMRGQSFHGGEALAAGLVDAVGDKAFALGLLRREVKSRK